MPKNPKAFQSWSGTQDLPPGIREVLPPLIKRYALVEDITGPLCEGADSDRYIRETAYALLDIAAKAFKRANVTLAPEQLQTVSAHAAHEVFSIRSLNEQRLQGDISIEFLRGLPIYKVYPDYFEQTQEIVQEGFQIAMEAAALRRKGSGPHKK